MKSADLRAIGAASTNVVGIMPDRKRREARRAQQTREIEDNQEALRRSIAESQRLIDEATEITQRHRREVEDDERE